MAGGEIVNHKLRITVTVVLTAWRESTPPGMLLRDWNPASAVLPSHQCCGEPRLRGAAAAVRDEYPIPGAVGNRRWSWRIWTPIGTLFPYRSGGAHSAEDAMAAADEALAKLVDELDEHAIDVKNGDAE